MRREDIIKKLISEKGMSLKSFAKSIDMPYSTFYSILKRGLSQAAVDNVIKICKGLDITVEELEEMAEKDTTNIKRPTTIAAHADDDLTEEEMQEVEEYIEYLLSKRNK